jgi:hypothetical protein
MRKFHHNKVMNIVIGVWVYSQVGLVIFGSIALIIDMIQNGSPTSFGIYG